MDLFDKVADKFQGWAIRWAASFSKTLVVHEARAQSPPQITAVEFCIANIFGGFMGMLVACALYFASFYPQHLGISIRSTGSLPTFMGAVFLAYAVSVLITLLVTSVVSYAAFRILGSAAAFRKHVDLHLDLTLLEPVSGFLFALAALTASDSSPKFGKTVLVSVAVAWLTTRVWCAALGAKALRELHGLSMPRYALGVSVAFLPAFIFLSAVLALYGWLVVTVVVMGWD